MAQDTKSPAVQYHSLHRLHDIVGMSLSSDLTLCGCFILPTKGGKQQGLPIGLQENVVKQYYIYYISGIRKTCREWPQMGSGGLSYY